MEWLVKEHLFTLPVLNIVFEEIFITIASVPLKAHKTAESIFHDLVIVYYRNIHVKDFSVGGRGKFDMPNEPVSP